jgi:hypothetical protein
MNKARLAVIATALAAGTAFAATETDRLGVTTSTDPDKVAAVEQHARELQQSQRLNTSGTQAAGTTKHKAKKHRKAMHTSKHSTSKSTSSTQDTGSSSSGTKTQ